MRTQVEIDSMDFLNIVQAVCDETGIDIPERDYPLLASVDSFAAYVQVASAAA